MIEDLISLAVIVLVAAACPLAAQAIPKKPIPETVFLLIAGAVLGPNMVGAIHLSDSIGLLSELGLAFLFLLAGYEIDPKNITGHQGKRVRNMAGMSRIRLWRRCSFGLCFTYRT